MKALTVWQPWAWAIFGAGKDVENRPRGWRYRGPLLIHAGLHYDEPARLHAPMGQAMGRHQALPKPWAPRGEVLGVVQLVGCHTVHPGCCRSVWGDARAGVHLVLEEPRALPHPVRARGSQGLWSPSAALLEDLLAVGL